MAYGWAHSRLHEENLASADPHDLVTAGDPGYEYEQHRTVGCHFCTDHGRYVAVQPVDGGALMIDAGSRSRVAELSAATVDDLIGDHS